MTSKQMLEHLSAMIDGELDDSQAAFLLRRLGHDEALRAASGRFHLIGDCLRRHPGLAPVGDGFALRVTRALAQEPAPAGGHTGANGRDQRPRPSMAWLRHARWAAGFATAAVVAAGAFWHVQSGVAPDTPLATTARQGTGGSSEVAASGVRIDDLRRQLPLLPVSARQSRPLSAREFAPQPDPQAWQEAQVAPLHLPATQYIIVLPAQRPGAGPGEAR